MNQNDLRRLAAIGGMDLTQPSVSFKDFNMFKNKGFDLLQDYKNTNKFIADNNLMQPPVDEEADKKAKRKEGLQNLRDTLSIIGARRSGKYALAEQMKQQVDLRKQQEEQQKKQAEFMSIPKQVLRSSYDNNQEYYRAIGQKYIDEGYLDQGLKFLEIGKPTTPKDLTSTILSQRDKVEKQYSPVKDNVLNFQKLDTALNSDSGTGAYTALVFYLKNLDGSVVKSEEVNTFQEMQGFLKNIEQKYEKTKGEGMTDEVKAQLRNISAQATALTVKGYNDYLAGSKNTYNALGLNPDLIYDGYLIDTSGINLGQVDPSYFEEEIQFTEKK